MRNSLQQIAGARAISLHPPLTFVAVAAVVAIVSVALALLQTTVFIMDSATLRSILAKTDGSAPAIKNSAGAMMRLYDTSAGVAVSEWRNALQTCKPHQLLPLLYVANEVLQNSKRNRGTKFLEAFSPVLGASLILMVQRDESILEKVRRTVKIWADRRVLSVRFVNELLQGLEPYRNRPRDESPHVGGFSPEHQDDEPPTAVTAEKSSPETEEDARVTLSSQEQHDDDNVESDNDLGFGDSLGHLDVDLNIFQAANSFQPSTSHKKRRRNSSMTGTSKRRKTILSTTSLMDLWNQVSSLQDGLDSSKSLLKGITAPPTAKVDQLVGDELLDEYKKVVKDISLVHQQKTQLHKIAKDRKALEQEAVKYIPWLQAALKNDDDDLEFCRQLNEKILLAKHVHGQAKEARDRKRQQEALERQQREEEMRKKSEEEERQKFMESAMKKESEAKPGMVWSRDRQEYVYLNTEESWRD